MSALDLSPLLTFADNGPLLHARIRLRLLAAGFSLNHLSRMSGISFSTLDRWRRGSAPLGRTVRLVEKALLNLESVTNR